MALGFVLVSVDPSHELSVFKHLMEVPEIEEMHPLFGEDDFLVKVRAPDYPALARVIVDRLRSIDGVQRTETLTVTSLGKRTPAEPDW